MHYRGYTGLCVLHCMRWFDGERIARLLGVVSFLSVSIISQK
jgi:hypothetical protein